MHKLKSQRGQALVEFALILPLILAKANNALGGDHSDMDITFLGAGNPPGGFPLDNISGTIYAAGPRADFENALFGNANLAVLASCIFIDGGAVPPGLPAANFQFNSNGGSNLSSASPSR